MLASRKQLLWIRDGAVGAKRVRVCASDNENFRACMSLLRVITANESELDHILGTSPYGSYRTASDVHFPISLRNECAALSLLKHTCQSMLSAYPRTLNDDVTALAGADLAPFSNERHARIHVKSEKVVLSHYIDFTTIALDLADKPLDDFNAALTRLFDIDKDKHLAAYCNGILRQVRRVSRAPPALQGGSTPIDLLAPTIV